MPFFSVLFDLMSWNSEQAEHLNINTMKQFGEHIWVSFCSVLFDSISWHPTKMNQTILKYGKHNSLVCISSFILIDCHIAQQLTAKYYSTEFIWLKPWHPPSLRNKQEDLKTWQIYYFALYIFIHFSIFCHYFNGHQLNVILPNAIWQNVIAPPRIIRTTKDIF